MKLTDLAIRKVPMESDIQSVETIVRSTGFFREDEIAVAVELVEERLSKGHSSGYRFLFADLNGETVAYTCYGLIPCTLHSFDLYWIASHNAYRGIGVGSYMLKLTEDEIRREGGNAVYIETSAKEQYRPTRNFYEKNGYLLKAVFDDFYDKGDDKLVYVKKL